MFFVEVPVDVLLHEQVEAIVKVAPHVRVEMDSSNALWMRRYVQPVQLGHKTAPAVHHHIPEILNCNVQGKLRSTNFSWKNCARVKPMPHKAHRFIEFTTDG